MGKRYSPSNKFNLLLMIVFFIVGNLLSFIITTTAALIGLWLFPPYAGMILVFISSWAIYCIQKGAIKYSKNRNLIFSRILVLISSFLISFFHMASIASISQVMKSTINNILPSLNVQIIKDIFIGSIALFSDPMPVVKSFFDPNLSQAWSVYFFIIIISNLLVPQFAAEQATMPFSEEAKKWMKEVYSLGRFEPFPDREQHMIVSAMKREDLFPFLERPSCTAQDPVDYGLLVFYKVENHHSGYVGVRHYHQKRTQKGQLIPNSYQMIEFIPPIQVGSAYALKLENAINATAMTGQINFLGRSEEENGYKLYRTAAEAADYHYNLDNDNNKTFVGFEKEKFNSPDDAFYFKHSLEDIEDDYSPYNPALNPNDENRPFKNSKFS